MNTGLTIEIPGGIAELPDLSLAEAVALSLILENPGCTNRTLARFVRQTERGVETMLCRLRERRLIRLEGSGRGRRMFLAFHVEHKKCGESLTPQIHVKRDDPVRITTQKHDSTCLDAALSRLDFFASCMDAGNFDAALSHISSIREALKDTAIAGFEKKNLLALLKIEEDRCFAFALGAKVAEGLTATAQVRLASALNTAPAAKLAALRDQAEGRALQASVQNPRLSEVFEKELLT